MRNIATSKRIALVLAILASVLLVVSIPMIPISVIYLGTPFMIASMIGCVIGFYTTPFLWIYYAGLCTIARTLDAIHAGCKDVRTLSMMLSINEKEAENRMRTAVARRYIGGYLFDGRRLITPEEAEERLRESGTARAVSCPYCGAQAELLPGDNRCPYCQSLLDSDQ